ncbi:hypothetical protein JMJ77_0007853 [Colletotrichum scovillei]|uniref:Uncharacterized protein n=1 Tax=Colletotrichum scovillei TaxID=1209932 RepID=A0A9P7REV2_9PEZI|nr:hypothetical protein JMJ77_0007853 [Colletotrichum scovillei]KAG7074863.1 hypothetical protein JMJ76_0011331 [Colletotrichum scovillei]KAG7081777.1 hypothetical protein JMJ78_0003891 [Colletotrichum scovillei]
MNVMAPMTTWIYLCLASSLEAGRQRVDSPLSSSM